MSETDPPTDLPERPLPLDVEGTAPVPTAPPERPPERDEEPPRPPPRPPVRASGRELAFTAVLPGSGHIAAGARARGGIFLVCWAALLGVAWLGRGRIAEVRATGAFDGYLALGVLLLGLAAVWGLAFREMLAARRAADADAAGEPVERERGDSQWVIAARRFRRNRLAMAGLLVVGLLYLVALLAPLLAPYDPIQQTDLVATGYMSPSSAHWLGTDLFGRDILSRIIYGARISLAIAFIAVAISISLGTLLGAVGGFFGGWVDTLVMRFTDMVLAFPRLVLLILIIALFRPSLVLIILVLGLTQWPGTARIVRGEVLTLREREFVQAARALGMRRSRIIARHIVPNVLAPVIVAATLGIGNTIVMEAGLSFLGLGVQPPTPSWGNMVADGRQNLLGAWWVATFPGLAIVVTVLAFNLAGDGLRDALDPRLRD